MKTKTEVTHTPEPSFDVSKKDAASIHKIAVRAVKLADDKSLFRLGEIYTLLDCDMDLTACHANGCPLKLKDLLEANPGDFGHDVFGIRKNLNRETGELGNCFLPRFHDNTAQGK